MPFDFASSGYCIFSLMKLKRALSPPGNWGITSGVTYTESSPFCGVVTLIFTGLAFCPLDFLVVTIITPLAPFSPYASMADWSLRTIMLLTLEASTSSIVPSLPSIITRGDEGRVEMSIFML